MLYCNIEEKSNEICEGRWNFYFLFRNSNAIIEVVELKRIDIAN